MKMRFPILLVLILIGCTTCDYAIDRIEVPEQKDKAADWKLIRIDRLPHKHTDGGATPTSTYFFYNNGKLEEVHKENEWKKFYFYEEQLVSSRIQKSWDERDTLGIDSFSYFDLPVLLKEKISYSPYLDPQYGFQKTIYKYQYNAEGNMIKEESFDAQESRFRFREIRWNDGNPIGIKDFSISSLDTIPELLFTQRFTYDSGINYERYKRWDIDAILPKNNQLNVSQRSVFRTGNFDHTYKINYDRRGRPIQLYGGRFHLDTLELIYQ